MTVKTHCSLSSDNEKNEKQFLVRAVQILHISVISNFMEQCVFYSVTNNNTVKMLDFV